MRKIGLFGGSFDPVHKGHIKLALECIKQLSLDEVWFVVAYDQPLKECHFETFEHRVHLLEVAVNKHPNLRVLTLEKELPKPSYSFNTVLSIKEHYPEDEFVWIIGSDNVETLNKWYRIDELKEMIEFVVVNRNDQGIDGYRVVDFNDDSSSTQVRHGKFEYLDDAVRDEIFKHHYYMETILYHNLSKKRADHVKRCVAVGLEIAACHDFDLTQVYQAIVLHDITKEYDKDLELDLMKKHFSKYLNMHHKVYHQYTGSLIAKEQYMISDEAVTNAIMHHTTGTDDAPLSQLVYVADKVERGRPYDVEAYIALAKEDLNQAFLKVKADAEAHRKVGK